MTISLERADEIRSLADPVEECVARLVNSGIAPHEIAQVLVLNGAGLQAATPGPKHAGFDLRTVAQHSAAWIQQIAAH